MKKVLPFDALMDYADGRLEGAAAADVAAVLAIDPEAREMVAALRAVYGRQRMDARSLRLSFEKAESRIEKRLQSLTEFSDHFIQLNRQLRRAAAVFALVVGYPLFISAIDLALPDNAFLTQKRPYELAGGSKTAP